MEAELAQIEILGLRLGCIGSLSTSISGYPGLFGNKAHMDRQRAAWAGAAKSVAEAAASRRNGAKGGRPRKAAAKRGS
jgi:hypothetical protein